ncbi:MAG TPA: DUF6518 family protein [Solirubrobacteraceae bacterium]|nr:DUF6518 family protein [Solirubrobacteraceae bacterium]
MTITPINGRRSRGALTVTAGLAVGVLTSFGQTYLNGTLGPFVNSVSAWLIAPFLLGLLMRTPRGGAAAGLAAALLQLLSYYVTAHLRGYPAGGTIVVFWAVCAVLGGPLFGFAAYVGRRGARPWHGIGLSALSAVFLAEGIWTYVHELHSYGAAGIWVGIALGIALLIPRGRELRWLGLAVPLAMLGEIALTQVYTTAF